MEVVKQEKNPPKTGVILPEWPHNIILPIIPMGIIAATIAYHRSPEFAAKINEGFGLIAQAINTGLPIITETVIPYAAEHPDQCLGLMGIILAFTAIPKGLKALAEKGKKNNPPEED